MMFADCAKYGLEIAFKTFRMNDFPDARFLKYAKEFLFIYDSGMGLDDLAGFIFRTFAVANFL